MKSGKDITSSLGHTQGEIYIKLVKQSTLAGKDITSTIGHTQGEIYKKTCKKKYISIQPWVKLRKPPILYGS